MGLFELLRGKEKEILDSINGITLSNEDIAKFGDVVHDYSLPHRDKSEAKKYGFDDTPVIGVHSAAIGGRFSRDLMAAMQRPDTPYFYTGQKVTFRDPIYPNEPINWNPPKIDFDEENGIMVLDLVIPHSSQGKKPRVEMTSEFRTKRPEFEQLNPENLVYSEEIELTSKELNNYYECLREEPLKEVPFSLGIGRNPSVLLKMASKLNEVQGTAIGGRNIEMTSQAYDDLKLGKARVDVYFVEKKGGGSRAFYTFDCALYQDDEPTISSRVKTMTNGDFDLDHLRVREIAAA